MLPLSNDTTQQRFLVAVFVELSIGMLGIFLGWFLGPDVYTQLPRLGDLSGIAIGVCVGALFGVVIAGLMVLVSRLPFPALKELQASMESNFREFLAPMTYTELLLISFAAGIGEEFLFRGWLQQSLTGVSGGETTLFTTLTGILAASLLFGMAHPLSRMYVVLASAMGILLGTLYFVTGNLLTAVVAHGVYDAIILVRWKYEMNHQEMNRDES